MERHAGFPWVLFCARNGLKLQQWPGLDWMGWGGKEKTMRKRKRIPMNLRFFGYDDPDGGSGGDGGDTGKEAEAGDGGDPKGGDPKGSESEKPKSFEEILKEGSYQAEFDRRVQKALGTAKEKWEALLDDKLSEADKLAKMTKEEKLQYQHQKREKELAEKEAAITRRELMAEAKNTLAEKKLPVGLAEVLNYADADSCGKSIAAVEKAFQEAVQEAVEEKLKGGTPPKKAQQGDDALAKQVENLMMGI